MVATDSTRHHPGVADGIYNLPIALLAFGVRRDDVLRRPVHLPPARGSADQLQERGHRPHVMLLGVRRCTVTSPHARVRDQLVPGYELERPVRSRSRPAVQRSVKEGHCPAATRDRRYHPLTIVGAAIVVVIVYIVALCRRTRAEELAGR
jgi:hypothetical protein